MLAQQFEEFGVEQLTYGQTLDVGRDDPMSSVPDRAMIRLAVQVTGLTERPPQSRRQGAVTQLRQLLNDLGHDVSWSQVLKNSSRHGLNVV